MDELKKIFNQNLDDVLNKINIESVNIEKKVIKWRRIIHQNPELGNREYKTAELVAQHLEKIGLEVTRNVAYTGVVGLLRGNRSEPVVALRADMDALPIKEALDLPFSSKITTIYNGEEVPVMHACGHDAHTAILMGVAEVLSKISSDIPGTIKFIFQPSEDSRPDGEEGGAKLMIDKGILENPQVNAIFGLHVVPFPVGKIGVREGGLMAGVDNFWIKVKGRATHGAMPWTGIDPIPIAAQIILGLQNIISRQIDSTQDSAILTIGKIHGGEQPNMIPNEVQIIGTVRTFNEALNSFIRKKIELISVNIADSFGACAEVTFSNEKSPVTYNDAELTKNMYPFIERVVGKENIFNPNPIPVGEDFAYYQQKIPGLFLLLGTAPIDEHLVALNHSPYFYVEESGLIQGIKTLSYLAYSWLEQKK